MDDGGASGRGGDDACDRHCPTCGLLMDPVGLPSGEIVARCPRCRQIAI